MQFHFNIKRFYLVDYRELENGAEKIFNCNEWRKYMYVLMSSSAVANLMKILQYCSSKNFSSRVCFHFTVFTVRKRVKHFTDVEWWQKRRRILKLLTKKLSYSYHASCENCGRNLCLIYCLLWLSETERINSEHTLLFKHLNMYTTYRKVCYVKIKKKLKWQYEPDTNEEFQLSQERRYLKYTLSESFSI